MNENEPKSPRDWLLARHAPATDRLDALRGAALPESRIGWREFLREVFGPQRHVWRALAVIWVGLVVFHFATSRPPPPRLSPPLSAAAAEWLHQLKTYDTLAQISRHP